MPLQITIQITLASVQGRGVATVGARGTTTKKVQTKKGPKVSVLNIMDIDFYGCSEIIREIIRTRNFTIFTVYAIIFGQFVAAFHFF